MYDKPIKVIVDDLEHHEKTITSDHAEYELALLFVMYANVHTVVYGTFNLYPFVKFVRHPETECINGNFKGTKDQIELDVMRAVRQHELIHDQYWGVYIFERDHDTAFIQLTKGQEIKNAQEKSRKEPKVRKDENLDCFFINNPWKLSVGNREQKIYRYCILCGVKRFTDEQWSKDVDTYGPPTICDDHPFKDDPLENLWATLDESMFMHKYCSDKEYTRLRKEESFTNEIIKKK